MNNLPAITGGIRKPMVAVLLLVFSISGFGAIEVIENPKPTHFEKNVAFTRLEMIHEIPLDISDEIFLADPYDLTVGPDGSLYVYDRVIKQIFQFDKNFKFVRTFGSEGSGPGEFGFNRNCDPISFSYDGHLYVGEHEAPKIIKFSPAGKFIKDIRLPASMLMSGPFQPRVDKNGNYYILDRRNYRIAVLDNKMNPLYTLLSKKDFERSLYVTLTGMDAMSWALPDLRRTQFHILPDNRLMVYIGNDSTLMIFDGEKLVRKVNIWPEMNLKDYKRIAEYRYKNRRDREIFSVLFSYEFFLDMDDEKYFYLQGNMEGKRKHLHYKYDLDIKLVKILYTEKYVKLIAKRNNCFYGLKNGLVQIYKEVSDEK